LQLGTVVALIWQKARSDLKASIVIINHNYAQFLRDAIESSLAQTYANTEVIVIDDGSTDDSAEVIKSYGERIIGVLKKRGGQSSCYARGLEVSNGDLVLYLDADDFLYPHCLSEVINAWPKGCAKAHFYLEVVDENGSKLDAVVPSGRLGKGTNPLKMMKVFGAYCSPPASGNIYSRHFLSKILPMENEHQLQSGGADSVTIFAAPYFGSITTIPRVLGSYRRHANAAGSVTSEFELETVMQKLEKQHQNDLVRDRSWRLAARQIGKAKLLEPTRLKRHICYLRLAGRGLDPADTRLRLLVEGLRSAIRWDAYSWLQKVVISWWFLGVAVLPIEIAKKLIHPALGISNRTPRLKRFLQAKMT
jgi:glycosyltransferase involved in cell wall biosynthesis